MAVPVSTSGPRITLAVVAYQQSALIDAAVQSALGQQCEPIEVLLSDDASPDDTFEKMQAMAAAYTGPHQVVLRRNPSNLGIGKHANAVLQAARGELIVLMAGDDISHPDRVARTAQAWDASGQRLDLIASHLIDMSHDGQSLGEKRVDDLSAWGTAQQWVQRRPYVVGAGHAITRRLFERFGPLSPQVMGEDHVNTLRAIMAGGACTVDAALVHHRRGGVSAKRRALSAPEVVQRLLRGNRNAVAELTQMLADARLAGQAHVIEPALTQSLAREGFIRDMFAATRLSSRLALLVRDRRAKLAVRLRMLVYAACPQLLAPVFWLKRLRPARG